MEALLTTMLEALPENLPETMTATWFDPLMLYVTGNLVIALPLALIAWAVQLRGRWPFAAHLLWVLVLIKLITPPLISVPMIALPEAWVSQSPVMATDYDAALFDLGTSTSAAGTMPALGAASTLTSVVAIPATSGPSLDALIWKNAIVILWFTGSLSILLVSVVRVLRFDRLLRRSAHPASPTLQAAADPIAHTLGLKNRPAIFITTARLSPLVWWTGGRVRIFLPQAWLPEAALSVNQPPDLSPADDQTLHCILAHELAHVRRRDHWIRGIEWLTCVCLWWHPLAWWTRRELRVCEEACCDALVLNTLNPEPKSYAGALLSVVEFLSAATPGASPGTTPVALVPPSVACPIINRTPSTLLERRFRMILSPKPTAPSPRWLTAGIFVMALGMLPLGLTSRTATAQDTPDQATPAAARSAERQSIEDRDQGRSEAERVAFALKAMVQAGEMTEAQALEQWEAYQAREEAAQGDAVREATLQDHYLKAGINEATFDRIAGVLSGADIDDDRLEGALGDVLRTASAAKSDLMAGLPVQIHPRMLNHFEAQGYTEDQIERITALAQRVAQSWLEADPETTLREAAEKVEAAIEAGDLEAEDGQRKLQELRQHLERLESEQAEAKADGQHESDMALTAESERVGQALKDAVAAGEITEAQAMERWNAHLESLKDDASGR